MIDEPIFTYFLLHIPSGETFTRRVTLEELRTEFPYETQKDAFQLFEYALLRWNSMGGVTWKYWN